MGMLSKLTKSGVAAKLIAEARKPHNQAKVRRMVENLSSRRGGRARPPR